MDATAEPSAAGAAFVSTGELPAETRIDELVGAAHQRFRDDRSGAVSDIYPALARVEPDLFGLCVAGLSGRVHPAGDAAVEFALMSVSKPFVFALVCEQLGPTVLRERIGVNATGLPFNSLAAVERSPGGRTNPMVNPGAIATTSLVPGGSSAHRWEFLRDGFSRFAGRPLDADPEIYRSSSDTNFRNRSIGQLLASMSAIAGDPAEAVDLYTRQCAIAVTARDLAVMGATLADGGCNPVTGEQVVDPEVCHYVLAVMTTAGMYESSGEWLYEVGSPAKSGIGGGIVVVAPGKGGLGLYGPRLDPDGNSVKGTLAARYLSRSLGLDLFASRPR
jgi:glutaminase